MARFSLTSEAELELETIIAYSQEKWGRQQADQAMLLFESSFKNIALFPESGQLVSGRNNIYQKPVARMPYWIIYEPVLKQDVVMVIQIIHTKRNW